MNYLTLHKKVYPLLHVTEHLILKKKSKRRCRSSNYCKDGVAFVAGLIIYVW